MASFRVFFDIQNELNYRHLYLTVSIVYNIRNYLRQNTPNSADVAYDISSYRKRQLNEKKKTEYGIKHDFSNDIILISFMIFKLWS